MGNSSVCRNLPGVMRTRLLGELPFLHIDCRKNRKWRGVYTSTFTTNQFQERNTMD